MEVTPNDITPASGARTISGPLASNWPQVPLPLPAGIKLILASTSRYRRELLRRLHIPFEVHGPRVEEVRINGEDVDAFVQRLAMAKAQNVAQDYPQAWVIGSDQAAALGEEILGKPGTPQRACEQLRACSGRTVRFLTAVSLIRPDQPPLTHMDETKVEFRNLSNEEIQRYVERERPLDCAGSFKVEGLGISLFRAVHNSDPTALIGLPLLAVCTLLREAGVALP